MPGVLSQRNCFRIDKRNLDLAYAQAVEDSSKGDMGGAFGVVYPNYIETLESVALLDEEEEMTED